MDEYDDPTRPRYEGMPVFVSQRAVAEMLHKRMSIHDSLAILEEGVDCSRGPRKPGVVERCAKHRGEWVKVVAVRDYHKDTREDCWLITHVGDTGRP